MSSFKKIASLLIVFIVSLPACRTYSPELSKAKAREEGTNAHVKSTKAGVVEAKEQVNANKAAVKEARINAQEAKDRTKEIQATESRAKSDAKKTDNEQNL